MRNIIISSDSTGGGKTLVTLGLIRALSDMGYKIQPYKVGPDYIDSAFQGRSAGNVCRNLDLFLMGADGVKASLARGKGDYGIIEGAMGLYDGKGADWEYSTGHLAETLGIPVVLVLTPRSQVATLSAEINGLMAFSGVKIAGVIFNKVSEAYYKLLKMSVETICGIRVFGYLPVDSELTVESRHLGLVQSAEIADFERKAEKCAALLRKYADIEGIMACASVGGPYRDDFHLENRDVNISVAFDKAFRFYYRENIEMLEELGRVRYFSPVSDSKIPDDTEFLYLGGGYPEVFIEEISENVTMRASIKNALEHGIVCYAECGGLMYLTGSIDGSPTVGFLNGSARMTGSLQNFGYAEVEVTGKDAILPEGLKINCHEFHTSYAEVNEKTIYRIKTIGYDGSASSRTSGFVKKNTLASYAHVHFFGNPNFVKSLVRKDKGTESLTV